MLEVPMPECSNTLVVLSNSLAVTMSMRPSPFISATAIENGKYPVGYVTAESKVPITHTLQKINGCIVQAGGDDIGPAIRVEVRHYHRAWGLPSGVGHRRFEGAVTVVQQHMQIAAQRVDDDDVRAGVAVEIADGNTIGVVTRRVTDRCLESAVTVVHQHVDIGRPIVSNDDVLQTITGEVPHRDGFGPHTNRIAGCRFEECRHHCRSTR